jgi:hypothetical protein
VSDDELAENSHFASPVTDLAYTRSIFSEINGCAGCACEPSHSKSSFSTSKTDFHRNYSRKLILIYSAVTRGMSSGTCQDKQNRIRSVIKPWGQFLGFISQLVGEISIHMAWLLV